MLVFRPQMEEVLTVKIKSCSKEGVHVSQEFFDNILFPAESLQHPSRFDATESVWVWEYPVEEVVHHDLFMDP
jgi:DNA-directed RNA polymerase III subunit RPC8